MFVQPATRTPRLVVTPSLIERSQIKAGKRVFNRCEELAKA